LNASGIFLSTVEKVLGFSVLVRSTSNMIGILSISRGINQDGELPELSSRKELLASLLTVAQSLDAWPEG